MRTFLVVIISVFAVLALVALFFGDTIAGAFSFGGPEGTPVRFETVEKRTLTESVSAPGTVEPKRKVDVSAEVSARIVELPKREGDRVRAGDLIMRLDDRDLRAALQSDEARRDGAVTLNYVKAEKTLTDGTEGLATRIRDFAFKANGVQGDITSRDSLDYLRGVLEIVKAAGYAGLVIVIDEAETILRMRKDSRHKSLNGIRQIADAAGSYPGLLWVFTGTPEFFDTRQGVAGLAPLHDRIQFLKQGRFASLRQAQLELTPFDADRLRSVAVRLRDLYPSANHQRVDDRVSIEFIDRLVAEVTTGFKGDVGVVPRQFLRQFVTQLDLVDEHADYDPMTAFGFEPQDLTPEEQQAISGTKMDLNEDDEPVASEDIW